MSEADIVSPAREFKTLLLGLSLWTFFFAVSHRFGQAFTGLSREWATLVTAALLTALAFAIVIGYAKLSLHRTTYLLLGFLAIGLVFKVASPMVARTTMLDTVGKISGNVFFMTGDAGQRGLSSSEILIHSRNEMYNKVSDFLEELFVEPLSFIFFLGLAQLLLAAGIGLWIGNGIDQVGHLIPIALVAGGADIWSVSAGATAIIIQTPTIHYFLLRFPLIGSSAGGTPFLIGLTDFLFFGIFYQAAVRFELGPRKNIALLGLAFLVAVTGAVIFKVGLPVLPFMALFFIIGNFKNLKLHSKDLREMILFLLFIAFSAFIFTKYWHQ